MVTVSSAVYHDRKMLKWLPFQSLPEQGKSMRRLREKRELRPKPTLSADRLEALQRALEAALESGASLSLIVHESGRERVVKGTVSDADFTARRLRVGMEWVNADDVIDAI